MDRRDILKMIVAATGTAFVGSNALAYELSTGTAVSKTGFSSKDLALMNEIGEVILPQTDTPGAKQADVASIMAVIVTDCFTQAQQALFRAGLADIKKRALTLYQKSFAQLSAPEKMRLLTSLDKEANTYNAQRDHDKTQTHPFSLIKQQVLFGFFTSKIGSTKVLRYVAIPGRYDGYFPYKKGDKAWAT